MLQKNNPIKWLIACAIILLPALFFPLSATNIEFIKAAETISSGGHIYVDFIGLKPAFLYYLYWAIIGLFTNSVLLIHLLDIAFQLFTCFLLFRLIYRQTNNQFAAGISIITYAIFYVAQGYTVSLATGMFAANALIIVLSIQLSEKQTHIKRLIIGAICGLLAGMNYTFAILFLAIIFDDILSKKYSIQKILVRNAIVLGTFIGVWALTLLPLLSPNIAEGSKLVYGVLAQQLRDFSPNFMFIKNTYATLGIVLGYNFSFLILFAICGSIYFYLKNVSANTRESELVRSITLFGVLLFASILIENNMSDIHFVRLYPVVAVLSGLFFTLVIAVIKTGWQKFSIYKKVIIFSVLFGSLFFSPLVQYSLNTKSSLMYFINRDTYNTDYKLQETIELNKYLSDSTSYFKVGEDCNEESN